MQPEGFDILAEEGPCLVVRKPGGLLTQAAPGIDSLEIRVKEFLRKRDNKEGGIYLAVMHRLDRPVGGALVMAKHVRAARRISQQFEGRLIRKLYTAVVQGHLEPTEGTWRDYLHKIPGQAAAVLVEKGHPDSRSAVLHYRVQGYLENATILEIELDTGRYHQIRVQAATRGFPILGDSQYGSTVPFGPQTEDPRQRWIALHAKHLCFRHPMTDERREYDAPLYDHWNALALSTATEPSKAVPPATDPASKAPSENESTDDVVSPS